MKTNLCGNSKQLIIEGIRIEGMYVHASEAGAVQSLIVAETRCRNFHIKDFKRDMEKDVPDKPGPTILARNLRNTVFRIREDGGGKEYLLSEKQNIMEKYGTFEELVIETGEV